MVCEIESACSAGAAAAGGWRRRRGRDRDEGVGVVISWFLTLGWVDFREER